MKLVVGLGNPGKNYEKTRHNVGFVAVDSLVAAIQNSKFKNQNENLKFKNNLKLGCCELKIGNYIFAKPNTFMNNSGRAVKFLADYYKINPSNIWVIHDDLDIKLGEYKIQFGKGPKLHYGISSIEKALGTKDFWRVRIGVDNRKPDDRTCGEEYVLGDFSPDEIKIINETISEFLIDLINLISK